MERSTILRTVRSLLFSTANKEFLIFLFFLALSGIFWLFMTLDEHYEHEIMLPIDIVGIPSEVMMTSDETDTLHVTVSDEGIAIFSYLYGDGLHHASANFKTYDQGNGTGIIPANDLKRLASKRFNPSTKIISIKPERLKFYYSTGNSKRVPVHWSGRVIPQHLYFLSRVKYTPDSVTVYAAANRLDSISTVYTEPLNYASFRDTLSVDCQLQKIEGVKFVPNQVKVEFFTDVLTEESVDDIPVTGINLPEGKVLRTFPAKVSVHFVTGVSVYRNLKPSDFLVVADYNSIKNHPKEKCELSLKKFPDGISRAFLATTQVDYLIEDEVE